MARQRYVPSRKVSQQTGEGKCQTEAMLNGTVPTSQINVCKSRSREGKGPNR